MSSANGSTTPVEPPPNWGVSPAQATEAFNWAHMPPQMSAPQQQQQQGQTPDMNDMLDPQVFNSLAELLIQSQNSTQSQQQYQQQLPQIHQQQMHQQTQQQQQESFDLLSALAHAQSQMQSQQQPTTQQVGSENSNSASLLTRRMQQAQTQPQYSRPNSVGGSANGTPNTSSTPQYSSPTYVNQQQTMLDPASMGRFPTPPQTFSSSFQQQNGRSNKSSSNPTTPWPVQDRQLGYSGTPATTPGGSEFAYTSPVEVSHHCLVRVNADQQNASGPSRAPLPIQPRRREAPLPPAPTFHETPSQGSSFRSSYAPQHSSAQPGSQKSVSFKAMPEHEPVNIRIDTSMQQPQASGSGFSGSNLPPLPPGFDIAQLAQLGGAGLEMAIRMGIEMGMNLNQQQSQPQTQQQPQTMAPPSPHPSSVVVSPISQNTSSPEKGRKGGRGAIVNNILHDNFLATRATPSAMASPVPLPSFTTSRRPSHGDTGESNFPEVHSPDEMAKNDPLASQVWKAYARDRGTLPNGARMENLTWRLMHLTLKKTEEREAKEAAEAAEAAAAKAKAEAPPEPAVVPASAIPERGRSKGKSRVVGFQGASSSPE
jgi:GATA-binding protein